MGFLNGAYGKLMAGKLVRDIQYQMTGVQSRLRRVTRQIGDMEKQLQRQQKQVEANLKQQMMSVTYAYMNNKGLSFDMTNPMSLATDQTSYSQYTIATQMAQVQYSQAQAMWEQYFEMQRQSMLEPLKDEEESLQTEKDNLESRLKIAEAEYEAKKKEEDSGVKTLTPQYTGQG